MPSKFEVARFDGTGNFGLWQTRVKDLLAQQGISRVLSEKKPAKVEDDKWEDMQAQACGVMRLCLSDQVMYHVMDESSPKKIWDKLAEKFMSKTLTQKLYLKQKLYRLKMQEGSDLAEHVNVFNQLIADLGKVDVKIDEEDRAIILLCSLPGSYDHLVTTLTYGKENVKVDDVVAALLSHEQRRKSNSLEESPGSAFVARGDRSGEDKKGNRKKKGPQCYKCKEWGHKKAECPELKKGSGTASVMITRQDDSDSEGDILTVSSEKSCEAWLLDSASSFLATSKKEWFLSYVEEDGGFVHLGDDSGYCIIGVGDIKFKMYDGQEMLLKGVKHVPGLRRNLISLGILHGEGWLYQAVPDKKTLRVMHGDKTVMIGEKSSAHQYKLMGSVVEGGVMDGNATVAVFYPKVGEVAAASPGCSK
jgi:hypothetical protein